MRTERGKWGIRAKFRKINMKPAESKWRQVSDKWEQVEGNRWRQVRDRWGRPGKCKMRASEVCGKERRCSVYIQYGVSGSTPVALAFLNTSHAALTPLHSTPLPTHSTPFHTPSLYKHTTPTPFTHSPPHTLYSILHPFSHTQSTPIPFPHFPSHILWSNSLPSM